MAGREAVNGMSAHKEGGEAVVVAAERAEM